jgi:hypothetical protein
MALRKYRILMITSAFPPFEFSEALVNAKLVLALKNAGHEVEIISRTSEQYYNSDWSTIWKSFQANTHYIEEVKVSLFQRYAEMILGSLYFGFIMEGVRWGKKAVQYAENLHRDQKFDVILSRMPSNIPHLVAYKLAQKTKLPWIANWNDPTNNIRPLGDPVGFWTSLITNYFVRKIFRKATLNSFPSRQLWEHYNREIIHSHEDKAVVIPHIGIAIPSNEKPSNEIPSICHAGNLLDNIDVVPLIQALSRLKNEDGIDFSFNVFGVIKEELPHLIESYGIKDHIMLHKPKAYQEMLLELQKHDYLMMIEAKYPEGILMLSKLSDYASTGVPIIAISPKVGVTADYLTETQAGIILNNQSTNEIYLGLKALLLNREKSYQTDALYQKLSPDSIVGIYEQIFRDKFQLK